MKLFRGFLFAIGMALLSLGCLQAATVDTVLTYSPSMKKNIKAVVIKPDDYAQMKEMPVVYLLHGYSGNYTDWLRVQGIAHYADLYQCMLVLPDGNFSSWYFDSPEDSTWKYETYVSRELVSWIDGHFKTIHNRTARAITGLSMGGHGALFLAFRHQDVFGAAGSMSGGVDLRPFPNNWDIAKRLGSYDQYPQRWEDNSVVSLVKLLRPDSLAIIFDCGSSDFFYKVNVELHEKLLAAKIPHDFISRPGAHNWDYWSNAVSFQLLFMHHYFEKTHSH